VKVQPLTSETETLLGHTQWWVRPRGSEGAWQAHTLESGRRHGATLLAQLSGLPDREAAARLSGSDIGVPRSSLPPAGEGEYYWADLTGLAVVNREGVTLGVVTSIEDYGAHPVLRVAPVQGTAVLLIPFVPAYVDRVDMPGRRIEVDWQPDY
jgi:16S rRNA processing protein RimM